MIEILYFLKIINIHISLISIEQYASIINILGYKTSLIVIPTILLIYLIYGLLLIGIIWYIYYFLKIFKYGINLTKINNKKGKILLITQIIIIITLLISIIFNMF